MQDKKRAYCKEHSLYEDECIICKPKDKEKKAGAYSGHDHSSHAKKKDQKEHDHGKHDEKDNLMINMTIASILNERQNKNSI